MQKLGFSSREYGGFAESDVPQTFSNDVGKYFYGNGAAEPVGGARNEGAVLEKPKASCAEVAMWWRCAVPASSTSGGRSA